MLTSFYKQVYTYGFMILRNIFKNRYFLVLSSLSFSVLLFDFLFAYVNLWDIDSPLVLHFNIQGVDVWGNKFDVLALIFVGAVLVFMNFNLVDVLYNRDRLLSYIFAFFSLILPILILIAVSVIVSVN